MSSPSSTLLSLRTISFPKANPDAVRRSQHNITLQDHLAIFPVSINPSEFLQNSHDCISHLGQSKLLSNTDPGSAIERKICPWFRRPPIPAFRAEVVDIWKFRRHRRIIMWIMLKMHDSVHNRCILQDSDRLASIRAPTMW